MERQDGSVRRLICKRCRHQYRFKMRGGIDIVRVTRRGTLMVCGPNAETASKCFGMHQKTGLQAHILSSPNKTRRFPHHRFRPPWPGPSPRYGRRNRASVPSDGTLHSSPCDTSPGTEYRCRFPRPSASCSYLNQVAAILTFTRRMAPFLCFME